MEVGQRVIGNYFKVNFTGVITYVRQHSMNNNTIVHIYLDDDIDVFGDKRRAIAMEVSPEGCASGYPGRVVVADPITAHYAQSQGHGQPQGVPR